MSSINISNATSGEKEVFFIDEDQALFETRGKLITIYRPVIRALNETEQVRLDMLQINPASGSHYLKDGFGYLVTHRLTRKKFFDRKEMKIYDYNKKGDVIYQLLVEKREVM